MAHDVANSAGKNRHTLMLLADAANILQNGNPFVHDTAAAANSFFWNTLDEVHKKVGPNIGVLSALLRDTPAFQALSIEARLACLQSLLYIYI